MRLSLHLGFPRTFTGTDNQPSLVARLACLGAAARAGPPSPNPTAGPAATPRSDPGGANTPVHRPRRRRKSITEVLVTGLHSVLRQAPKAPAESDSDEEPESVDLATQLERELALLGCGVDLEEEREQVVLVENNRVVRVIWKLGEAFRMCGGLVEPRVFMQTASVEDLVQAAQWVRLGRTVSRPPGFLGRCR